MTRLSRKNQRRIIASLLTGVFMMQPTMLTVVASEIVSGGTAMTKTNGAYNIDPSSISGNVGFREYTKFNLTEGDIANLIYKYGANNIDTFVNLMQDSAFNINGVVNSMRDGNFYNGKAVFISPKGVIVGASGVLNVGSFGAYTPDPTNEIRYQKLLNAETRNENSWNEFENAGTSLQTTGPYGTGEGIVRIEGKVLANKDVVIRAGDVNLKNSGAVFAGVNKNLVLDPTNAENLFNTLVSTDNLKPGTTFSNDNGKIVITSSAFGNYDFNTLQEAGTKIDGKLVNLSTGGEGISIENKKIAGNGININGDIINLTGKVDIANFDGNLKVGSSGTITNYGTETELLNRPYTTGTNSELKISGNINTPNGNTKISNFGNNGLTIDGSVNTNTVYIQNGFDPSIAGINRTNTGAMNITGRIKTTGNAELWNTEYGINGMNISGVVDAGGSAKFTNDGAGGLNVTANTQNTNNIISNGLEMYNTGENGLNINGKVQNTGTATVYNYEGGTNGLNIGGTFNNTEAATFTNDGSAGLNVSGTLTSKTLNMTNNGTGGMNFESGANVTSNGNSEYKNTKGAMHAKSGSKLNNTTGTAHYINTGSGGMLFEGTVVNTGTTNAENKAGEMRLSGSFTNTGNSTFTNDGTALNVSGTVTNNEGKLILTNNGAGGLNVIANSSNTNNIVSNGIEMNNTGENGLNINGKVQNTGTAAVYNHEGGTKGLNIGGAFNNTGAATFTNDGNDGLNTSGTITSTTLTMINNGNKGLNFKSGANVTSSSDSRIENNGGVLHAQEGSNIKTKSGKATYINHGNGGMLLEGNITNGTLNTDGTVANTVTTIANNYAGEMRIGGNYTNYGVSTFKNNDGGSALNVTGNVTNYNDKLTITNDGSKGLTVTESGFIDAHNQIAITNNGTDGLIVEGGIANIGNGEYINNVGKFEAKAGSYMSNNTGTAHYYNKGNGGMLLKGKTENVGTTNAENTAGEMLIAGDFTNKGSSTFTNTGTVLNVTGTINKNIENTAETSVKLDNTGAGGLNITNTGYVKASTIEMKNTGKSGLNVAGTTTSTADTTVTNSGADGFNTTGTIEAASGNINTTNTGAAGTNVKSTGEIKSMFGNTTINDTSKGGVNIEGYVKGKNVNISSNGGNVTMGDNTTHTNPSYVYADENVNITSTNGSILNYGVEKILIKTRSGDLTMNAENGTIGLGVQQNACNGSGCTGIGPKADAARDFTKSINTQIAGKVNAHTNATSEAAKQEDLVINYASIGSDMKVDTIKADGRVILTVDDDYGATNNGKKYSIVNARPNDNTDTNIEGWGISLIADKNIGTSDNKVTFIQNRASDGYKMDALANKNIYLKENSFNDSNYGREKEVKNNEVCTMIAREGDMYVEFAGDTNIKNITAEGNLTVITRGQNMNIDNLGHIKDASVEPKDYFGTRDYGLNDNPNLPDGGNTGIYGKEPLPNKVVVKALDINHNIRPTEAEIEVPRAGEGTYEAYANSTVKITNAVVDKGHMDITADNVYANGIEAHFNKDGFSKIENNITNKTDGVFNALSDKNAENNIPNGHAVRPGDVSGIGRNKHERNYYYNKGNGNMANPFIVVDDNNDNIADATPLALEKNKPINPPHIDDPTPKPKTVIDDDGRWMNIPRDEDEVDNIDKRQYMRFNVNGSEFPILLERTNNGVTSILDVSRGGVALAHDGSLKVGDIVPLHMKYADMDVHAQVKVVSATTSRAGAEFVNIDKGTANQLLYLNIVVDNWHNALSLK